MPHPRRVPVSIISRYLVAEFWSVFRLAFAAFVAIYVIVDLFDRLNFFIRNQATAAAAARYLAFKLPLIVTQITPPAVLASVLLSLALLGRRNELIALRANGVSVYRLARPLLVVAGLISAGMLVWNETVVPLTTRAHEQVNLLEIRHQAPRTILSERGIWYHGSDGFYNIDHIDRYGQTLYGIVIYRVTDDFELASTIEAAAARWTGEGWDVSGATERRISAFGDLEIRPVPAGAILQHETIADFLEVYREPEELSYATLRTRIQTLTRKGIDASRLAVDLHLKLAVPLMSVILAALAIPIAGRATRNASVAATVGVGTLVGFSYWVVLALSMSLGHSGALPPLLAAWAANLVCALLAAVLFLSVE